MPLSFVLRPNRLLARRLLVRASLLIIILGQGCVTNRPNKQSHRSASSSASQPNVPSFRKVYAYSLIPGGVATSSSFEVSRMNDVVLSEHFHDLAGTIVPTKLARDRLMYSSFRIGDRIYWTKHPILISAGEPLLTDGNTLVRARCGNRLSNYPQRPVQKFSPPGVAAGQFTWQIQIDSPPTLTPEAGPPITWEFPNVPLPVPYDVPIVPSPPLESGSDIVPLPPETDSGVVVPIVSPVPVIPPGSGGGTTTPPVATANTPEPSTWMVILAGMTCFYEAFLFRRWFASRQQRAPIRKDPKSILNRS